jgi:hypothetical protein
LHSVGPYTEKSLLLGRGRRRNGARQHVRISAAEIEVFPFIDAQSSSKFPHVGRLRSRFDATAFQAIAPIRFS